MMGKIHDCFTLTFGTSLENVRSLLWSLGVYSHPVIIEPEYEIISGMTRRAWRFVDLYVETVPESTFEQVIQYCTAQRLPIASENIRDSFKDLSLDATVDNVVLVEFKTAGSKEYPFDLGDVLRQMKVYQERVRMMDVFRNRRNVIPVLIMPASLRGKTSAEMEHLFETLRSERILYRTYKIRYMDGKPVLDFTDLPRSPRDIVPSLRHG